MPALVDDAGQPSADPLQHPWGGTEQEGDGGDRGKGDERDEPVVDPKKERDRHNRQQVPHRARGQQVACQRPAEEAALAQQRHQRAPRRRAAPSQSATQAQGPAGRSPSLRRAAEQPAAGAAATGAGSARAAAAPVPRRWRPQAGSRASDRRRSDTFSRARAEVRHLGGRLRSAGVRLEARRAACQARLACSSK